MIFQIRDFEKRAIENGEIVQIEKILFVIFSIVKNQFVC